jgi:glycosyltransferase involved in cell wall biosynthesis
VQSVDRQTARALEVILVNDGDVGATENEIVRLQSEADSWIRVVRLAANSGASVARNAGWEAARGDFVAFLDADDAWHPRKLEIQLDFMRAHSEFPFTAHLLSFESPRNVDDHAPFTEIRFRSLLYRNWFHTSSVMLRRDLPQRFDPGKRYGEDRQLWLDVVAAGHRIARLDLPLLTIYKPMYGASGLSAQLWAMEVAELETFRGLRRARIIGAPLMYGLLAWSLARYLRRLLVVGARRALTR